MPDLALSGESNACSRFREDRLLIGDLQARHFVLEEKGSVKEMPPFSAAGKRSLFRRTFGLSLDVAEPIALFHTVSAKTIVIGRDRDKRIPVRIPVFFVGREKQSLDDLKADAELAAFAPSSSLHDGDDFAAIQFHLRKGGSRFDEIRPFFACGLPGLLLCEGSCPGDSALLASSLVDWTVSGAVWPPLAKMGTNEPALERLLPCDPLQAACSQMPAEKAPNQFAEEERPPTTVAAPKIKPLPQLLLSFADKTGSQVPPGDVLAAEGKLSIEGAVLSETEDGLTAGLPESTLAKVNGVDFFAKLLPHYSILDVQRTGSRFTLKVEPLFVQVAGIKITITNAALEKVRGCNLALKIAPERRAGRGWENAMITGHENGLRFRGQDAAYELELPKNVDRRELLISTAQPGSAAWLSANAPGCALEARPEVMVNELQSGSICRSLKSTGPVLIALLSSDAALSDKLGAGAIEGFWSEALDLAGSVSDGNWERKLLARAQSFGPSPETRLLEDLRGKQKLSETGERKAILKSLVSSSLERPEPLTILAGKPVERFHLDLALTPLRDDAALNPVRTLRQESLLLITGGGGLGASYFCREPVPEGSPYFARPEWLNQAKRTFALEVWTEPEALTLQAKALASQPEAAPQGVYACKIDGSNVALFGVVPASLSDSVRADTFAYLTAEAKAYLKP